MRARVRQVGRYSFSERESKIESKSKNKINENEDNSKRGGESDVQAE